MTAHHLTSDPYPTYHAPPAPAHQVSARQHQLQRAGPHQQRSDLGGNHRRPMTPLRGWLTIQAVGMIWVSTYG